MRTIREELIQILKKANQLHSEQGSYRMQPEMEEWLRSVTTSGKTGDNQNPVSNETTESLKQ
jgi:hypothetical protein